MSDRRDWFAKAISYERMAKRVAELEAEIAWWMSTAEA